MNRRDWLCGLAAAFLAAACLRRLPEAPSSSSRPNIVVNAGVESTDSATNDASWERGRRRETVASSSTPASGAPQRRRRRIVEALASSAWPSIAVNDCVAGIAPAPNAASWKR
jgi:hypothetical protein